MRGQSGKLLGTEEIEIEISGTEGYALLECDVSPLECGVFFAGLDK